VSPLAAQWQGGFCQRTCGRCDCSPGSGVSCSIVQASDVDAANGVVHGISRVLFPPPLFTKEQAIRDAVAYNESVGLVGVLCVRAGGGGGRGGAAPPLPLLSTRPTCDAPLDQPPLTHTQHNMTQHHTPHRSWRATRAWASPPRPA
jgi:hypothetical protein